MYDNADLAKKIEIRQRAIELLGYRPKLVIDAYSGEGVIASMFWRANADRVICIEKSKSKARTNPMPNIVIDDNTNHTHLFEHADIIDCDAYGLSMPLIEKIPSGKMVVFTDGTPEKARKVYKAWREFKSDFDRLLTGEYFISSSANVIYGYGVRK